MFMHMKYYPHDVKVIKPQNHQFKDMKFNSFRISICVTINNRLHIRIVWTKVVLFLEKLFQLL